MKRILLITLGIIVTPPVAFMLLMRFFILPGEGYPTWEGVRNTLIQDGEITINLPQGVNIISADCDFPATTPSINGQTITTKIGYSWCTITIEAETNGAPHTLQFNPQKLNDWNRIRFAPINPNDPFSDFRKIENGVEKTNVDFIRNPGPQIQPTPKPNL